MIEVYHQDFKTGKPVLVAKVNSYDLEFAWRWTNNVEGSWSRRDLPNNPDANDFVEVVVPLHVKDGKVYGLRSSMVGDIFILDGKPYKVANLGFRECELTEI